MIQQLKKLSENLRRFKLSSQAVDRLISYAADELQVGDEVSVMRGKYVGQTSKIISIDPRGIAEIKVKVFGKEIVAKIFLRDLEFISRPSEPDLFFIPKKLTPNTSYEVMAKYSQDEPYEFIENITPIFELLDDKKVKLVESVLEHNSQYIRYYDDWHSSIGQFLIKYPEYINLKTIGNSLFKIINEELFVYGGRRDLLRSIPESLLIEAWNNTGRNMKEIDDFPGFYTIIQKIPAYQQIFPNFIEQFGFDLATNFPAVYLNYNLDDILKDKINKEDVVENAFKKNPLEFLLWPESSQYPELEKKAVYKLVFDERSGWPELLYFFRDYATKPQYKLWTPHAIQKFINHYAENWKYFDDAFLRSDFGEELIYKTAINLIENKKYEIFFFNDYHAKFKDLGFKFAKQLLKEESDKRIVSIGNYINDFYPSLDSQFTKALVRVNKQRIQNTPKDDSAEWDTFFPAIEESEENQEPTPKTEQEIAEEDPDFQEYFERGT